MRYDFPTDLISPMKNAPLMTGEAQDATEAFVFPIKPFVTGGYLLEISYSGGCCQNVTGAGVWPSIAKAKEIAQQTADRLLHGARVCWRDSISSHDSLAE